MVFAAMNGERPSSGHASNLNTRKVSMHSTCNVLGREIGNCISIPLERVNELSSEERMRGLYDLHGVSTIVAETSETVRIWLQKFDITILSLADSKDDYERAKERDLDYVHSLRIRFLRGASFNVTEAARNMIYHFKLRQHYFGDKALVGNLTFANLKPEDVPFFSTGFVQLLSERDRSGRAIFVVYGRQYCVTPIDTILRIQLVLGDLATQDEDIQRKGIVYIYFAYRQTENTLFCTAPNTTRGNLTRIVATHLCYDNPQLHPVINRTVCLLSTQALLRFKCHFGKVSECLCSIRAFGVPVEALPLKSDYSWRNIFPESQVKYLTTNVSASSSLTSNNSAYCPADSGEFEPRGMDILLCRGKRGVKMSGYHLLKTLREVYRCRYEAGNRQTKTLITKTIFDAMIHSGSRFLVRTKDSRDWVVVHEMEAKKSIAHGFRNMRRRDKARMQRVPFP